MKTHRIFAAFLFLCLPVVASGQQDGGANLFGSSPPQPQFVPLKEFAVNQATVEETFERLHKLVPSFQAVIFRDSDIAPDEPRLTFAVHDASLATILQVIQVAYPYIAQDAVNGTNPANGGLLVVRVNSTPALKKRASTTQPSAPVVKVYHLAAIVKNQMLLSRKHWMLANTAIAPADYEAAQDEALNQTLSLLEATISQVGSNPAPAFKVHAPTLTLIFKGTAEQRAAVDNAIEALQPSEAEMKISSGAFFARVQKEVEDVFTTVNASQEEVAALKHQLFELKATTRPATSKPSREEEKEDMIYRLTQKRRQQLEEQSK